MTKHRRKSAPVRNPGPSVNPSSIEVAFAYFMARSELPESEELRKRRTVLESRIEAHEATRGLKELVNAGCDRARLLHVLGFCCGKPIEFAFDGWFTKPGPRSLKALLGLNGRDFSRLKADLLRAADQIDDVNQRFEFGVLLTTPHLGLFWGLPARIRGYVSLLDLAARKLGRGAHFYRNVAKAILTLYVKQQTGRVHDEQVSALLAAVEDSEYSARDYADWRKEHRSLFVSLSPCFPPDIHPSTPHVPPSYPLRKSRLE